MRRVILHVDRLVLRGVHRNDRHAVACGLEQGLQGLLSSNGIIDALVGQDGAERLKPCRIHVGNRTGPRALGAQAAQGIARSIQS